VFEVGRDIVLFERVRTLGLCAALLGHSSAHHKREAYQCSKRYLRCRRFQGSRNLPVTKGFPEDRRAFNIPLNPLPQTARAALRTVIGHLVLPTNETFPHEMTLYHFLGTIEGFFSNRDIDG